MKKNNSIPMTYVMVNSPLHSESTLVAQIHRNRNLLAAPVVGVSAAAPVAVAIGVETVTLGEDVVVVGVGLTRIELVAFLGSWRKSEAARVFTITNHCKDTIWPAIIPGDSFEGGGFKLKPGQSRVFNAPVGWSGRIWGRTGCNFDQNGNGTCLTAACGTSLKCTGAGETPASLAEFTLANVDFYDVSLVDGFNIPIAVKPLNGEGNCTTAGCDEDLRKNCPKELSVKASNHGKTVACRSACDVFNTDEYCCRGLYGGPSVCHPTYYSKLFKQACPTAYSYAYDDPSSIFTCSGSDYVITFCSSRSKPVCTYHNNKLICSGSTGLKSMLNRRWSLILVALVFLIYNFVEY